MRSALTLPEASHAHATLGMRVMANSALTSTSADSLKMTVTTTPAAKTQGVGMNAPAMPAMLAVDLFAMILMSVLVGPTTATAMPLAQIPSEASPVIAMKATLVTVCNAKIRMNVLMARKSAISTPSVTIQLGHTRALAITALMVTGSTAKT
eukprot:Rmarinus@m.6174